MKTTATFPRYCYRQKLHQTDAIGSFWENGSETMNPPVLQRFLVIEFLHSFQRPRNCGINFLNRVIDLVETKSILGQQGHFTP